MIDAHFHSWQIARGDYGWLNPALAPLYRDVSVADWQAQSQALGISGGVLVQAAPTEAETLFLLAQAQAQAPDGPGVLGVVGWVDLLATNAADRISALAHQYPLLKGLRPMLQDIPDPDWILQAALSPALQAMAAHGLVFDALVKPVHLPRLLTLAARHPKLSLVIDHAAKPDIAAGQWQPWADQLARLAAETHAVCKLSGLLTEAGPQPRPDAARHWGEHVLASFGADRVMWGSDWPVLELAGSYGDWWQEAQQLSAHLSAAERANLFGGTARRIYRLSTAS
ncbi:L-fuconolactonase [Polaromonas sp. OV174]|uniref:amidohydrolase family protein n=1 Tax=Polaromonas sp. OV174 TaxID=1855300 RepID=UPI0008E587DC|nr:amidohydrolase family protein [Polaromonas sp. OV174]SFB72941.1 L-fuconolactonase [Polaromonas sp. OV174]